MSLRSSRASAPPTNNWPVRPPRLITPTPPSSRKTDRADHLFRPPSADDFDWRGLPVLSGRAVLHQAERLGPAGSARAARLGGGRGRPLDRARTDLLNARVGRGGRLAVERVQLVLPGDRRPVYAAVAER